MSANKNNIMMSSSSSDSKILRGVVFDMDGTLTKPNLDFAEMYRRCGVDRSKDILEEIDAMTPKEQEKANQIIDDMEEEGRRTLELMPGCIELMNCLWKERWCANCALGFRS